MLKLFKSLKVKIALFFFLAIFLFLWRYSEFNPGFSGKGLILTYWLLASLLFAIDGKISVLIGILLFLSSSVMLLLKHEGLALRVSLYSYGFLFIGAIIQFISLLKEKEKK